MVYFMGIHGPKPGFVDCPAIIAVLITRKKENGVINIIANCSKVHV